MLQFLSSLIQFNDTWIWWTMVKWIAVMKFQPSTCPDDWGRLRKNLSQVGPHRDLNPGNPECESRTLPRSHLARWINFIVEILLTIKPALCSLQISIKKGIMFNILCMAVVRELRHIILLDFIVLLISLYFSYLWSDYSLKYGIQMWSE